MTDQWTRVFEATIQTLLAKSTPTVLGDLDELLRSAVTTADVALWHVGQKASERERTATPERPSPGEERQHMIDTFVPFVGIAETEAGAAALDKAQEQAFKVNSPIYGLDVSLYQGWIDWTSVMGRAREYRFVYAKATEGITYKDSFFAHNWTGAKAAGVKVGGYHFFHPSDDPVLQAENFSSVLKGVGMTGGDLRPVVDVEETRIEWASMGAVAGVKSLTDFLHAMFSRTSAFPMLYTNVAFANEYLSKLDASIIPAVWIAAWRYLVGSPTPMQAPWLPNGWDQHKLKLWQHSPSGSVPGITGPVDLNLFLRESLEEISL